MRAPINPAAARASHHASGFAAELRLAAELRSPVGAAVAVAVAVAVEIAVAVVVGIAMLVQVVVLVTASLVADVLLTVTLADVTVAGTTFMSGGATVNEDSTISMPCDWKCVFKFAAKLEQSFTISFVISKICSAETKGATISNPTSHELKTDRADA